MKKKVRFSKRTTALIVAAVLLFAGGGVAGTRAALTIQSEYYRAEFYLNHLQVHLLENGEDVCERAGHRNTLDTQDKEVGELATALKYEHKVGKDEVLGKVEPGMAYQEVIQAQNGSDIDEFVRVTIRKYWMEKDEDGNLVKSSALNPDRIKLYYGEEGKYNSEYWTLNKKENLDKNGKRSKETSTYYYKTDLSSGEKSQPLFNKLKIDATIADFGEIKTTETQEGNKTVYTYEYQYDGCVFYIEADVQAIQTHNVNDAIRSQWGVDNVTANYNDPAGNGQGSGTLSVN